jgi:toxin YoeB
MAPLPSRAELRLDFDRGIDNVAILYWLETDRATLRRINALITDIQCGHHTGIGKPEPLRSDLRGWWSRRITGEHRLIYRIVGTGEAQRIEIMMCRFHYGRAL